MFNNNSRTNNAARAAFWGATCNVINTLFGFGYRTIFLYVLSANYLGINGLFTNILNILSFADLGISNVIIYRFYKPISENNIQQVGRLMCFFKNIYRAVALFIFFFGMLLLPFINFFVADNGELPRDVNLQVIYLLFLFQTVSSYLFIYKQTLLNADQKQYISSLVNSLIVLLRYIVQIIVLFITKNYILVLTANIVWTVITNYCFSLWVQKKYADVFLVKDDISTSEKKQILSDTKATMCHKIGGTVLTSTDNIVISKFVGIFTTGVYSNYSLLLSSLSTILNQLLGGFTSSLGNAHVEQTREQRYTSYKRLLFANLWITIVCTVCLYILINDFIINWLGVEMLLPQITVVVLCLQFFIETSRIVSMSYTNGSGLFVKDKIRPLIEAIINLTVSIILVKLIGISGVFIGTIVSHLCTVSWREPYLLYKYEFKTDFVEYWKYYFLAGIGTFVLCVFYTLIFSLISFEIKNIGLWFAKASFVFITSNIIILLFTHKNKNFIFYKELIVNKIKGVL